MSRQRLASALVWPVLALVVVSVLLPNGGIRWMRVHWAWFNLPMGWIEHAGTTVNLVHAILFAVLGGAVRLALPRWRAAGVALGFLLFGIASELAQFFVPGRHPRVSDVIVDVVAGTLGWMLVRALRRTG